MQFKDIVGQQKIKQHLLQTVKENRLSHAQLFLSPLGSGAFPLAIAYAQYINCLDKKPQDSCGVCGNCSKYQKLIHPDLHFSYPFFAKKKEETAQLYIDSWRKMVLHDSYFDMEIWRSKNDAANKQPNINIAECHDIIKKLSFKAFEAETKVLIMWLPEYLDKQGNALLKLIEEPPANTLFILVAQNQEQILTTILSRTQIIKIPKLTAAEITNYLIEEGGLLPQQAADYAFLADGNMVEAKGLVADVQNDHSGKFTEWLRNAFMNKVPTMIDFAEEASKWGRENQKNFLRFGINFLRECCLILGGADELVRLSPLSLETAKKLSEKVLSLPMAEGVIAELEKAHYHIERNGNPKIVFLDVSLQLVKIINFKILPEGIQYIYN
ncbi:DNA polymerase-3 subunit delta' [Pedobacter sp. UYEF25]